MRCVLERDMCIKGMCTGEGCDVYRRGMCVYTGEGCAQKRGVCRTVCV